MRFKVAKCFQSAGRVIQMGSLCCKTIVLEKTIEEKKKEIDGLKREIEVF